jgi:hypothetical protein
LRPSKNEDNNVSNWLHVLWPANLLKDGFHQVWFLGENANYAAAEYAWESATSPSTALMMLDGEKMVAAASSRNPTLAGAVTRLQRCAISGSWEVIMCTIM